MERRFIPTLQPPSRPYAPPREEAADFFSSSYLFFLGDGETLAITSISQRHGFEYPQPSRLVFFFIIMPRTGKLPSPSFYRHIPLSSAYRHSSSILIPPYPSSSAYRHIPLSSAYRHSFSIFIPPYPSSLLHIAKTSLCIPLFPIFYWQAPCHRHHRINQEERLIHNFYIPSPENAVTLPTTVTSQVAT